MVFTWQMAEELAAGHMRSIGFADAKRTPEGVDGGIDVIASGAVAQVKSWDAAVGAPEIQRLRGAAHNFDNALFYSRGGYTLAAKDAAEILRVALFGFTTQNEVVAKNSVAEELEGASANLSGGSDLSQRLFAVRVHTGVWMAALGLLDQTEIVEDEESELDFLASCEENCPDDEELIADVRARAELASAMRAAWERGGQAFVLASVGQVETLHDRSLEILVKLAAASRMPHGSTRVLAMVKFTDEANRICAAYTQFRSGVDETFPEIVVNAERMCMIWAASSVEDDPTGEYARFFATTQGRLI